MPWLRLHAEEYRPPLYYGTATGGIETWSCFECHGWDCDPYEGGDDEANPSMCRGGAEQPAVDRLYSKN